MDGGCFGKQPVASRDPADNRTNMNNNNNNDISVINITQPIDDDYYKMDHGERGLVIIFNHENFDKSTQQDQRNGTDKDVKKIKETFGKLGFLIECYKDLTLSSIQQHIDNYVQCDCNHKKRDCLVVFVLTHGNSDGLWARDAFYYPAIELWGKFTGNKCPSFAGKPKLFFIQACQGSLLDDGIKVRVKPTIRTEFDEDCFHSIPINIDFLMCYATFEGNFPGYFAFRHSVEGSLWVTILCEELEKDHTTKDILSILTKVNRRLAIEYSSNARDESKSGKKQVSYFKSSLTKLLVLGKSNP